MDTNHSHWKRHFPTPAELLFSLTQRENTSQATTYSLLSQIQGVDEKTQPHKLQLSKNLTPCAGDSLASPFAWGALHKAGVIFPAPVEAARADSWLLPPLPQLRLTGGFTGICLKISQKIQLWRRPGGQCRVPLHPQLLDISFFSPSLPSQPF